MFKSFYTYALAALLGIVGVGFYFTSTAQAQSEPAPIISFDKIPTAVGSYIEYKLLITNSGNADSSSMTVQDTLPAEVDWWISGGNIGCSLIDSSLPGRLKLDCNSFVVPKRFLNDSEDAFINGTRSVTISGIAQTCGQFNNTALLEPGHITASAGINIECPQEPTPSPSPTVITPTNTPSVGVTPVPQPSSTSTVIIPKPPATGNSGPYERNSDSFYAVVIGLLFIGLFSMWVVWRIDHDNRS